MASSQTAKAALKKLIKRFVRIVGGRRNARPVARILTYHSIGARDHEMNVTPAALREQMAWLAANATVISLEQAARGEPGVAVTIDDGYRDALTNAAPVLTDLRVPATVFVVAGRFGGFLDHDDASRENRLLARDEVFELHDMGIDIGSHALTHRRLSLLPEREQAHEISESKRILEQILQRPVPTFAYPFGSSADFDATSVRLVQESGYTCAASNRYGVNAVGCDRWCLRRIWVDATDDLAMFQAKVDGRLDRLALLDTRLGTWARRALNRVLRAE